MASTTDIPSAKVDPHKKKSDWSKTFGYVGVAAACLAITGLAELFSRPPKIKEFGKVGQEFYPEFTDPTVASGLEVFAFDEQEVSAREFQVARQENGLWVIPSHHNYPADAEDRLAQTASSVIGIKRGAMVTRWSADHGRYGVVNPKQDSLKVEDVEGVGQRLILKKDDESVLADYVIGKKVEGQTDEYYVRHPQEDEVYIAKLDIDLSTKFTDWIDDKLFEFSSGDVLQLDINDYVFDDRSVTESIVTQISREEAWGNDWELEGLDPESQEIDTQKINDALSALSSLEVIGVRPKQKGLTPELTLDRENLRSSTDLNVLQQDLFARGFALQPGDTPESLSLISREGELWAGTEEGLQYQLYFGRVFTGSQEELEVGFADGDESSETTNSAAESDEDGEATEANAGESEASSSSKPGRYLFVRVSFDEDLITGPTSAPIEPEKPARLRELEAAEKEKSTEEAEAEAEEAADETSTSTDEEEDGETEEEPSELEKLREEYDTAKQQYDTDLRDYESRQEKIKEGQEKAEQFNRRFAQWYYVVPGESFEKLDIARADLVKPKEQEEGESEATDEENVVEPTAPFVPPPTDGDEQPASEEAEESELTDATNEEAESGESDADEEVVDDTDESESEPAGSADEATTTEESGNE